jgi:hypothetical protein
MKKNEIRDLVIDVVLEGEKEIIFNKFVGIKDEQAPTEKKFDYDEDGNVFIQDLRIYNYLFDVGDVQGHRNTIGAIKLFTGRKHKELVVIGNSCIEVEPEIIYITRNGKKIKFTKFGENGVVEREAKTGKGKPQIVKRPQINLPWEISFKIKLAANDSIQFDDLKGWFEKGGKQVGLGAWRPRHGQFKVKKFEIIN